MNAYIIAPVALILILDTQQDENAELNISGQFLFLIFDGHHW